MGRLKISLWMVYFCRHNFITCGLKLAPLLITNSTYQSRSVFFFWVSCCVCCSPIHSPACDNTAITQVQAFTEMTVTELTLVARPNTFHSTKYCSPPKLNTAGLLLVPNVISGKSKNKGQVVISCNMFCQVIK